MRNIKLNELKLKNNYDEDIFYQFYLENLENSQKDSPKDNILKKPIKQFEIVLLNEKILLLNKDYIQNSNTDNQDLYYDYNIAYKIYNYLQDIYEGIEDEKQELNELYKDERLDLNSKIDFLKKKDEDLFKKAKYEYSIITESSIYKNYLNLIEENKKLKEENIILKNQINTTSNVKFIDKIINKFKKKSLLNSGDK